MNPFEFRGPEFLFFFIVLSVIVLILTWLLRKSFDGSDNVAMQSPATLVSDPYLIAHLRGGADETLRVAAMSLIDRGVLQVESDGTLKTAVNVKPEHLRRSVERAILGLYANGGQVSALSSLKGATDEYEDQLRRLRLLPDAEVRAKRWMLFLFMLAILGGVALIKIMIGLSRDRPVGFLFLLAFFSVATLWRVAQPRRTSHGDNFLASVRKLFGGLKDRAESLRPGGATADLALLAAVFGMGFVPTNVFPYRTQLYPASTSTSNCGSSSSCSSSSCGGGCGGGGCGGCGS